MPSALILLSTFSPSGLYAGEIGTPLDLNSEGDYLVCSDGTGRAIYKHEFINRDKKSINFQSLDEKYFNPKGRLSGVRWKAANYIKDIKSVILIHDGTDDEFKKDFNKFTLAFLKKRLPGSSKFYTSVSISQGLFGTGPLWPPNIIYQNSSGKKIEFRASTWAPHLEDNNGEWFYDQNKGRNAQEFWYCPVDSDYIATRRIFPLKIKNEPRNFIMVIDLFMRPNKIIKEVQASEEERITFPSI